MNWWTSIFRGSCQGEKPGGLSLTCRGVDWCGFHENSRILDVASGDGATIRYLRAYLGCEIIGIDSDPVRQDPDVIVGQAEQLPWSDGSFDGVLMECALSQMEEPLSPLGECVRVLRGGGRLILSDLYDQKGEGSEQTLLGRMDSRNMLEKRLRKVGLAPVLFEDHSRELVSLWAGAIMNGTGESLSEQLRRALYKNEVKYGYYLCIAEKF